MKPNKFKSTKFVFGAMLLVGLLTGCKEETNKVYPDYKHAQQAQLFDKGWLPSIIPMSVENIHTENDLDNNTSKGRFVIGLQSDVETFKQLLQMVGKSKKYQYSENGSTWIFMIENDGNVHYTMFPTE